MAQTFSSFYEGWMINHQNLHEKLLTLSFSESDINQERCRELIAEVFAHYEEYYRQKSRAVNENVFLMLSPTWLSLYERALLWISDFKPSTLFPQIQSSLGEELSDEQEKRIQRMKAETRRFEKEIEQEMAKVQESIAHPQIFNLLRRFETIVDGEISELDEAMEEFKENMMRVMGNADGLRGTTVLKLVEILSPFQTVKFLAGAFELVLQARKWGSERNAQNSGTSWDDA